jgi:predicted dehydrogenase
MPRGRHAPEQGTPPAVSLALAGSARVASGSVHSAPLRQMSSEAISVRAFLGRPGLWIEAISMTEVAVIGCGAWGRNLVRNFHQLGALALVCDTTEAGRALATETAPGVPVIADVDDVLRSAIPAVIVATPAETHHQLGQRALEAGKDVFVEKPLALTYDAGAQLVRLAQRHSRILMVGHVLEYHPAVARLLQLVRDGALGRLHYIYSNRLSLGKVRREENILWSFAPHDVAVILRLLGSLPFQVIACGGSYVQPNIADVTVTQLLFDNGVRAHIHVSWLHPFKEQRLVVIGSLKMASFDDVGKQLILYEQRVELREGQPVPVKGQGELIPFGADEPLRLECRAFLDAVTTRRPPLTDGQSGLRVLKVLQAAQRSLVMNGEPVTLPIETFDPEGGTW